MNTPQSFEAGLADGEAVASAAGGGSQNTSTAKPNEFVSSNTSKAVRG